MRYATSTLLFGLVAALPYDGQIDKRQHSHGGTPMSPAATPAPKAAGPANNALADMLDGLLKAMPNMLGGLMSMFLKTDKVIQAKSRSLDPKLRKDTKRAVLWWGPYELKAPNGPKIPMLDAGTTMWTTMLDGLPKDATYLWANSSLVFEDGSDATIENGVYLHHYGVYDMDKDGKQLTICPGLTPARPALFTGGGEDKGETFFTTPNADFNSGFYISAKSKIMSTGMVVNYKNATQNVYARLEVEYVPGRVKDSLEVGIQSISVTGCGMNSIAIEPPKKEEKSRHLSSQKFPVLHDGYLIGAKGHLHDGGDNLIIKVNDKLMCDSKAVYGGGQSTTKLETGQSWETINHMTQCVTPIPVKKGDNITLEANYDFVKYPPRVHNGGHGDAELMGMAFMAFGWQS